MSWDCSFTIITSWSKLVLLLIHQSFPSFHGLKLLFTPICVAWQGSLVENRSGLNSMHLKKIMQFLSCLFLGFMRAWAITKNDGSWEKKGLKFCTVAVSTDLCCAWVWTFRNKVLLGTRRCKHDWVPPRCADSRGMWRLQDLEFWIIMCCCVCRFCCLFLQSQYFCCVPSDLSWPIPPLFSFIPFFNLVSTRIRSKPCLLAQRVPVSFMQTLCFGPRFPSPTLILPSWTIIFAKWMSSTKDASHLRIFALNTLLYYKIHYYYTIKYTVKYIFSLSYWSQQLYFSLLSVLNPAVPAWPVIWIYMTFHPVCQQSMTMHWCVICELFVILCERGSAHEFWHLLI